MVALLDRSVRLLVDAVAIMAVITGMVSIMMESVVLVVLFAMLLMVLLKPSTSPY